MGFIPSFCRALILLHKAVRLRGPLLTLGNQDVWADYDTLRSFFQELDCPYEETEPLPHTSRLLAEHPEATEFVHARTFFAMMGITDYSDLDKFEIDSPQILHDLNVPVPAEWHERYNLIIDSGTTEHIFDVRRVMANIVNMCGQSGWVVHIAPVNNWVDHGYYSFSPCFFYDFYHTNGFTDFIGYVLQVNSDNFYEPSLCFQYSYGMDLSRLIDPERRALIFFAAKKERRVAEIAIPTQGVYDGSRERAEQIAMGAEPAAEQPSAVRNKTLSKYLRPLLRPLRSLDAWGTPSNSDSRPKISSHLRRL